MVASTGLHMGHCRNQVPSRSCRKYETELLDDDFMELGYFHKALSEKTNAPNLTSIATMTAVTNRIWPWSTRFWRGYRTTFQRSSFWSTGMSSRHGCRVPLRCPLLRRKCCCEPPLTSARFRQWTGSQQFRTLSTDRRACQRVDARCHWGTTYSTAALHGNNKRIRRVLEKAYRQWMRKPRRINWNRSDHSKAANLGLDCWRF